MLELTLGDMAYGAENSTFDVRRSTFDVRRSTFDVRRSTFDVRRSTFDVRIDYHESLSRLVRASRANLNVNRIPKMRPTTPKASEGRAPSPLSLRIRRSAESNRSVEATMPKIPNATALRGFLLQRSLAWRVICCPLFPFSEVSITTPDPGCKRGYRCGNYKCHSYPCRPAAF
jgi:hypothetical protein